MIRVYVAGPYNADNICKSLDNMRRGMRVCTKLATQGYAPFCPWHDYHFQLMLREGENLNIKWYYDYCIEWLQVSEVLLVLEGYETSVGTKNEITIAEAIGLPIVYSEAELHRRFPPYGA